MVNLFCIKVKDRKGPITLKWEEVAIELEELFGDKIEWKEGQRIARYNPLYMAFRDQCYIHFEKDWDKDKVVLYLSSTPFCEEIRTFEDLKVRLIECFSGTVKEEKTEESHEGMVQGYDEQWRWF